MKSSASEPGLRKRSKLIEVLLVVIDKIGRKHTIILVAVESESSIE